MTSKSLFFKLLRENVKRRAWAIALAVLGTKSGREMDKINDSGLTPVELDGQVAFAEAKVVFVCKKIYVDDMNPEKIPPEWNQKWYADGDYHRIYTGQITGVYVQE